MKVRCIVTSNVFQFNNYSGKLVYTSKKSRSHHKEGLAISKDSVEFGTFIIDNIFGFGLKQTKDSLMVGNFSNGSLNRGVTYLKDSLYFGFYTDSFQYGFCLKDGVYSFITKNQDEIIFHFDTKTIEYKTASGTKFFPCEELFPFTIPNLFFPYEELDRSIIEKTEFYDEDTLESFLENEDGTTSVFLNIFGTGFVRKYLVKRNEDIYYLRARDFDGFLRNISIDGTSEFSIKNNTMKSCLDELEISFEYGGNQIPAFRILNSKLNKELTIYPSGAIEIHQLEEPTYDDLFDLFHSDEMNKVLVYSLGLDSIIKMKEQNFPLSCVTSNYRSLEQASSIMDNEEEELASLIGLKEVKRQIERFKNYAVESKKKGCPVNLHMVFSGNPGTGKTTVARLVGQILYKYGILKNTNFVECNRETLIAQYIGQTARQTNAAVQRAMGGILFIDEAYSLGYGGDRDFGKEAIAELIKSMEEYRGEFCVILAGYTDEMNTLFEVNPGLESRIQKNIEFSDYSDSELRSILDYNLKKEGYLMEEASKDKLLSYVCSLKTKKNFSNAREIRSSLEQLYMIQALRTKENPLDKGISFEDVEEFIQDHYEAKPMGIEAPMITRKQLLENGKRSFSFKNNKQDVIESIIAIQKIGINGSTSSTGFVISPDGYAITCCHCVENSFKLRARRRIKDHRGNIVETYHDCKIAGMDKESDVAIIKLDNQGSEFSYLSIDDGSSSSELLTKIIEIGYPFGVNSLDNASIYEGEISSLQSVNGHYKYFMNIPAYPGISGACILDFKTSKVIGITQGARQFDGFLLNYAGRIQDVWKLIHKECDCVEKHI